MCTAITLKTNHHYFGRNLDLEYSYHETITITPRNYPFHFRKVDPLLSHYAIIGVAIISNGYPLYYDATNEYGLSMAGLNFPGNAAYHNQEENKDNIAPYEMIPWILGQCKTVAEAENLLSNINPLNTPFSDEFPLSPLHWIIADDKEALTVEPVPQGLKVYSNPVGVLTNNPPFEYHLYNLSNYLNLTSDEPSNRFSEKIDIKPYSRGMGAIGLPGDLSSASRFVKAAFTKLNSQCLPDEESSVSQFFHVLGSVEQQEGCVKVGNKYEKTVYTSCCNTNTGVYYYRTYENSQISAVSLRNENLESESLIYYPMQNKQVIYFQN